MDTKCGDCREVYYCCRVCQQRAWKAHKTLCRRIVADRRSVAVIVGLHVNKFVEDEACSWIKAEVSWWGGDAEVVLALVRHLECFPLGVALATECACIDETATPAMYLTVLERAGSKRAKCRDTTHYPNSFPDVVKLSLDNILQSDQVYAGDAGQAMCKLAMVDTQAILLDLLRANKR